MNGHLNSQATAALVSAWERSLGGEVNLEIETKNDLGLEFTPLQGAVEKFGRHAVDWSVGQWASLTGSAGRQCIGTSSSAGP